MVTMPTLSAEEDPTTCESAGLEWTARAEPLRFRVGEIELFAAPLELLVCTSPFVSVRANAPLAHLPALSPGQHGYLVRSLPVDSVPARLSRRDGFLCYVPKCYRHRFIRFDIGYEAYLSQFSGKTRSTLRRKARKFASESGGELDFRCYRGRAQLEEFYRLARPLSSKTYQERLLDSGLPDDQSFRAELSAAGERDLARAFLLFFKGQPAAYLYAPLTERSLIYEYLGFDPALSALSPGTVLQWEALKVLFQEPDLEIFDFTEGDAPHKSLFANDSQLVANIYLLKPGLRTACLANCHRAFESATNLAAKASDRLGVKQKLKAIIRSRA
ncbi:MAG: GNAT family N-acetyltransferase [Pseudomonadota bacterium]